jgi:Raf kinase inhibitor-like YbhB/YbcL family protein
MKISSTAFADRKSIPQNYTCDGANISPDLSWTDVPKGAKSLVLVVEDPDAPAGTWVHWTVYNIPVDAKGLPSGVPNLLNLPHGVQQGKNSFHKIGYGGPCPPPGHGPHRYFFRLYALDAVLDIRPGVDRRELDEAMKSHIVGRAELVGRFERQTTRKRIG